MKLLSDTGTYIDAYIVAFSSAPFQHKEKAFDGASTNRAFLAFKTSVKTNKFKNLKYKSTGVIL